LPEVALVCHPQTPCRAVRGITARVTRPQGQVKVEYGIEGDIAGLSQNAGEPLWQHTCCELFVARAGAEGYLEFNFSPAGPFAAYSFAGYRKGMAAHRVQKTVEVRRSAGQIVLTATVQAPGRLKIGLSAVIEEKDGALSYWALRHPAGKPDFHHADNFTLELDEDRA
jgi:hypothetical protein